MPLDATIEERLVLKGTVGYTVKTRERAMRIPGQGRVRLDDLIAYRLPLEHWQHGRPARRGEGAKVLISRRDP